MPSVGNTWIALTDLNDDVTKVELTGVVALLAILPMAFKGCTNNAEAVSPTADTPADATLPIVDKAADDISPMASVTSSTADCEGAAW